jgi:peptidoglycan/LPS O-acetylase OafA/YrhL
MLNTGTTSGRIAVLDGWRCFSILLVMYGHIARWSSIGHTLPFAGYESVGVEFFFVISGFVICSSLLGELEGSGKISIGGFYIRRCFRILPPLILFLLVAWCSGITSARSVAKAGLFLCNLVSVSCDLSIVHTWSLAYEEQFYVLFPLSLVLALRFGRRWILLATALAWPVLVAVLYCFRYTASLAFYLYWFELLLFGTAFALYRDQAARIVQRIGPIGLYVAVPLIFAAYVSGTGLSTFSTKTIIMLFVDFPLMAYAVFASTCVRTVVHPILESRPARYLGRISYGVYLFQQPFLVSDAGQGPLFYIAAVIAIIVMAAFSYTFIEAPLIRLGGRLASRLQYVSQSVTATAADRTGSPEQHTPSRYARGLS